MTNDQHMNKPAWVIPNGIKAIYIYIFLILPDQYIGAIRKINIPHFIF